MGRGWQIVSLSNDLISQFVKATKDTKKTSAESTCYGTVVYDGRPYVKLDGSGLLTPVSQTTDVKDGERVTVLIKDHTATITGNITSPAARTEDVKEAASRISEVEILVADSVTTKELQAEIARVNSLFAEDLQAEIARIDELIADRITTKDFESENAEIKKLVAEKISTTVAEATFAKIEYLEAIEGDFHNLESTYGDFVDLTTEKLTAHDASIDDLLVNKLDAESANVLYANIDFANITKAAVEKLFSDSGIIKDLVVSGGQITGELVGVTIKGDLIKAGTLTADKLVVKGSDGIYYKLNVAADAVESTEVSEEELQNGLHGTAIIAKTITAEKIAVDDLVAFDATIGGFNITNNSLYSGVKESAANTTRGVYLDKDGQLSVGDSDNFLRYYKTSDGQYKLEISAASMVFSSSKKTVEQVIDEATDIEIGARNLIRNSSNLIFKDYYFANEELEVTDDGSGNVVWHSPTVMISDDGDGNIAMINPILTTTDDNNGNISIVIR